MGAELLGFAQGVGYALIVFFWLFVAKQVSDLRVRRVLDPGQEIDERGNLAVGLRRGGIYLGVAIGMLGALSGGGGDFAGEALTLFGEGAAVTAFLFVALLLTDAVVIHGIQNDEAVRDGNVAVGLAELGIFIATGLIAFGSFSGEGGGLASALVFFALGQLALLVLALAYERFTRFSVLAEIRAGNAAAGLMLGGMLVAFGFILNASLTGAFVSWREDLAAFGLSSGMGLALLLLVQWPIDRVFLRGTTLHVSIEERHNVAAVAVAVAVKIAVALVISAVLI